MRAAKTMIAVAVVGAACLLPASTVGQSADTGPISIHLVNVVGLPGWYMQELKDDVQNAYQGNASSIQFGTSGNKIYLETQAQRQQPNSSVVPWYVTAGCFDSDRAPSPDADVTVSGNPEQDAAAVTLAVQEIVDDNCPY